MRRRVPRHAHVGNFYAGRLAEIIALTIRDGPEACVCPWCEQIMEIPTRAERRGSYRARTIEHTVPKSQGGTDNLDNLVLACRGCNRKRGKL
jgi:5-methylcytosine-specific restriction endonuclease McrA